MKEHEKQARSAIAGQVGGTDEKGRIVDTTGFGKSAVSRIGQNPDRADRAASSEWQLDNQAVCALTGQKLRADLHRVSAVPQSALRKYRGLGTLLTLIASLSISGPSSFAQTALSIETAQPTLLTTAPTVSSPIQMKTLPEATCVLHAEGTSDPEHSLKLFADDEGMVRFHVRPPVESDQPAHFEVDCAANGKITTFPLHLRSSASPTQEMPAPAMETAKSRPGSFVRPALTNDDAVHLSTEELTRHGYPLRPDPEHAPGAFTSWLSAVTHPSTFVAPRAVANPGIRHGPLQATNVSATINDNAFSGYILLPSINFTLDAVLGTWSVPAISGYEFNTATFSALWVGLEGSEANGILRLWQAGTEQDALDVPMPWGDYHLTSYYAWTDFPQGPMGQGETPSTTIANFTVGPGDKILTQVWIGNPGQNPSLSGADAIAYVENLSRQEWTLINTCRVWLFWGCDPFPPQFPGQFALWIMERPSICPNGTGCVVQDLADYGQAQMSTPFARREIDGTWESFYNGNPENMLNTASGDLLSAASEYMPYVCNAANPFARPTCWPDTNNASILFAWHNYH